MSLNSVPDLPKDFNKADRLLKFGGTTMGIFKLNGGKLKVAYCYREWLDDKKQLCCKISTPLPLGDLGLTSIGNILEGMASLVKKDVEVSGAKVYAVVAGRSFIFRFFAERRIVADSLVPAENGRFQGRIVIGDQTYRLLAEETHNILGTNLQIAFVDENLQIIDKQCF